VKATKYLTQAEQEGGANVWRGGTAKREPKANWKDQIFVQTDEHPVLCISWNDAVAFAGWLSARDREGRRYRLPTEAEWEYACRAGTTTAYCSGSSLEALKKVAWCSYDGKFGSAGGTKPVGQFQANGWGLYDMHGNAWEWCQDWHEEYARSDQVDPQGLAQGFDRVIRGGGWNSPPSFCRSAFRIWHEPGFRTNNMGCRLVLVPSGEYAWLAGAGVAVVQLGTWPWSGWRA
jgi:formylglycine-generating enzyme required for sulfatase activity